MITLERDFIVNTTVRVENIQGNAFNGETAAHQFVITAITDAQTRTETSFSGTATAYFIRSDDQTLTVSASVINGKIYATLNRDCYNQTGRFTFSIFNQNEGVTTCVYSCKGWMYRTRRDPIIDSGEVVPNIDDVTAEYQRMQTATDAATAAAAAGNGALRALAPYNAYDMIAPMTKTSATVTDVTFTWDEDGNCHVSGTAASTRVNNIYRDQTKLPYGMVPGGTYKAIFDETQITPSNIVWFDIRFYINGGFNDQRYCPANGSVIFTVPADATGALLRLGVSQTGVAVDTVVTPKIISGKTQAELEAEVTMPLTAAEVAALTSIYDVQAGKYFTASGARLKELIDNAPDGLVDDVSYLVRTWEYAANYAVCEIMSASGNKYFIGRTNQTSSTYIWADWSNQTTADAIAALQTKAFQLMSTSDVAGLSTIFDVPDGRYFSATGSRLKELISNAPDSLYDSAVYTVRVWDYAGAYSICEIIRSTGEQHFYGNTAASHPDSYTWHDQSPTVAMDISEIIPTFTGASFEWTYGKYINAPGGAGITDVAGAALTDYVEIDPGSVIVNSTPDYDVDSSTPCYVYAAFFAGDEYLKRVPLHGEYNHMCTAPDTVTHVRFCYGHTSSLGIRATKELTGRYFSVKMSARAKKEHLIVDASMPLYVAFGASTTEGAVWHFDGLPYTDSKYDYPRYVGNALGLRTINRAIGGTGLISRTTNYDLDNMMDNIFKASGRNLSDSSYDASADILADAALITLTSAWGNDATVANFTIGSYDDYYPYDEDGYHPSGNAGVPVMIEKGATWFGCLNWCIKWLGDHYPKAQLVLMFGRLSDNTRRTITMTENSTPEGQGSPKYKLNFANQSTTLINMSENVRLLTSKLNIKLINWFDDGLPWTYYGTQAKNEDGTLALFSQTGDSSDPSTWVPNVHPNDDGYLMFARYITGRISELFYRG